jgi:hypothetical protein
MAGLLGAAQSRIDAVTTDTHKKGDFHFRNWNTFLARCHLRGDVFLDGFSRHDRHKILGAFLHSVRNGEYSKSTKGNDTLVAGTCQAALTGVCAAFSHAGRPNPSLDANQKTSVLLRHQIRGYTNLDPSKRQQKAIPLKLLQKMTQRQSKVPGLIAYHELTILAYFFAMRSCEYLKTPGERRTNPLRLRNLVFRTKNKVVPHDDPNLHLADTISITFEYQKRDLRDDSVTQSKSGDAHLCPVRAAAAVVKRLRSFGAKPDAHIFTYADENGNVRELTAKAALMHLRDFIGTVNDNYGLNKEDIGLHSIRASAAMGMYLNGIPVYTIMLLGRWSSDAFLLYIRKQVTEFSNNVSRKMIKNPVYHHVPDADREDPRTHNPMAATANIGMGANGATINRNVFSVWA